MIYKIGIISKRYLIMFGILLWHVQLIVWSQIVHQAFNCTRLDDLQNWHHFQTVLDMFPQKKNIIVWSQIVHHFVLSKTEYGVFSIPVSSRAQDSRRNEARLYAPSRPRTRAA